MRMTTLQRSSHQRSSRPFFPAALAATFALLLSLALGARPAAAQDIPEDPPNDQVGIVLGGLQSPGIEFVDVAQNASRIYELDENGNRTDRRYGPVDENGWPEHDFNYVVFDQRPCCHFGIYDQDPPRSVDDPQGYEPLSLFGEYELSFKGQASITSLSGSVTVSDSSYDASTNTSTYRVQITDDDTPDIIGNETVEEGQEADPGDLLMRLQFTNTKRSPSAEEGSGVSDIVVIRPDTEQGSYELGGDNPTFVPELTEAIKPFNHVRYMTWLSGDKATFTNDDPDYYMTQYEDNPPSGSEAVFLEWEDRKLPSASSQRGPTFPDANDWGIAWEHVIRFANKTDTDPWINIRVSASEDYARQLGELFANGNENVAPLEDGRTVYVELGNEPWNPAFQSYEWLDEKSREELENNPDSQLNYDGEACANEDCSFVTDTGRQRYTMQRTIAVSQAFADGFGTDVGRDARVKPIQEWFPRGDGRAATRDIFQFVKDNYDGPVSDYVWGLSTTGYYGGSAIRNLPDNATVQDVCNALESELESTASYLADYEDIADEFNLNASVYEGGDNTSGGTGQLKEPLRVEAIRAARSKCNADLIRRNLTELYFQNGGDLYSYFTYSSSYNRYGTWGATDDLTRPFRDSEAPRDNASQYQALLDVLSEPAPEEDERPTVVIDADPPSGAAPLDVDFDGTGSVDPDDDITSYEWDFGDGSTATGAEVTHTYEDDGRYVATLTVTGERGRSATSQQEIIVGDVARLLANDPFDEDIPAGSPDPPLHGTGTGIGWDGDWSVQSENKDFVYDSNDNEKGQLLQYYTDEDTLVTTGNQAVGGGNYKTASRTFNTNPNGRFGNYVDDDQIGKDGKVLWMSALVRNTGGIYEMCLSQSQFPAGCDGETVGIGVYDDSSGEWALRDGKDSTSSATGVDASDGEAHLAVLKIDFSAEQSTASLYMNPASIGGGNTPPDEPDAQFTTDESLAFSTLGWRPGVQPEQGTLDEVRFGETFATVTPTQRDERSPGAGNELTPVADALVNGYASDTDTNYGDSEVLGIIGPERDDYGPEYSYLKFDVSEVDSVGTATLRVFINDDSDGDTGEEVNVEVLPVDDDTWTEDGITFNNRPDPGETVLADTVVKQVDSYFEWDVSGFTRDQKNDDGEVSLFMRRSTIDPGAAGSGETVDPSSKEGVASPQLVIEEEFTPGSSPGDAISVTAFDSFEDDDAGSFPSGYYNPRSDEVDLTVMDRGGPNAGDQSLRASVESADYQPFGNTVEPAFDVEGNGDYLNFELASQSSGEIDIRIKVNEDADDNGATDGEDDKFIFDVTVPADSSGWRMVNMPISGSTDDNPDTGDGQLEAVRTVGVQFWDSGGQTTTLYMDYLAFSADEPITEFNRVPVEFAGAPTPAVKGRSVNLSWTTLTETNNAGFYVQYRRKDGQQGWKRASDHLVPTKAENGTSNGELTYTHRVENLTPGRYSFRIQQKDLDGDLSPSDATSKLVEVGLDERFALESAYPNPMHPGQTVTLKARGVAEKDDVQAWLYNSLGQRIRELQVDRGEITFRARALSSGLYFVRLTTGDKTATQSVMLVR